MNGINDYEAKILLEMPDHRCVSDGLENAFYDGCLSGFRNFIIEHNKNCNIDEYLLPLLRGADDKIIVYRHNHKFWELSVIKNNRGKVIKGRVAFDFNHARFSNDWKEKLKLLKSKSFEFHDSSESKKSNRENYLKNEPEVKLVRNEKKVIIGGSIGIIHSDQMSFDKELFVAPLYEIVKNIFDDYFCHFNLKEDQFRTCVRKEYGEELKALDRESRSTNPEKRWQQRLYLELSNIKDGYYAYDLEFSQPFPKKEFIKAFASKEENENEADMYLSITADGLKEKLTTNEPDILAIRYDGNTPKAIVIMEVKSTSGACDDPSGIPSHLAGMYEYSNNDIFMKKRKMDAVNCLKQYKKFGFLPKDVVIPEEPESLLVERVLILTNANVSGTEVSTAKKEMGAIEYFEKNIYDNTVTLAEKYDCQIWEIEGNYFDEHIKVKQIK